MSARSAHHERPGPPWTNHEKGTKGQSEPESHAEPGHFHHQRQCHEIPLLDYEIGAAPALKVGLGWEPICAPFQNHERRGSRGLA